MNKKKLIWSISLLITCVNINYLKAQDNLGARIILEGSSVSNTTYYMYNPPFKAKIIYKDTTEAINKFPEQLMSSKLSANTQVWIDYNTLGGAKESSKVSQKEFDKIKNRTKDKNYFELLSKLEFEVNGDKMAIIKFYYYKEDKEKPIAGATVMQFVNGRWHETSKPYTTTMAMALMVFKVDVMNSLLTGTGRNQMENNLISKVYGNGLNFDKLLQQQDLTPEEKEYFTNPLNW